MKLGKAQKALLAVTVLFVVFTLAFFIGRRSVHAQITTERSPGDLSRELPADESADAPEDLSKDIPESTAKDVPERISADGTGRIDINSASQAELESLPGIGEKRARSIIQFREENGPFLSTEQLMDVDGIGEGIYADIKDLIYVEDGQ